MKNVRKILPAAIVILLCIIVYAGSLEITLAVRAKENNEERMASEAECRKTDIAQIFITTDNIINREDYVKAAIVITDAQGRSLATITDSDAAIRIRGNSTCGLAKLPYNIKLSSDQSVLGMSSGREWCLLANFLDTSLMRNKLAYDFAINLGLDYSCESRYADVWLNNTYLGNYLVTVPVETGKNRVDIDTDKNEFLLEIESQRIEKDTSYIETGVCRFKLDAPKTYTKEQYDWLTQFLSKAENAMESENYSKIKEYVDTDSFIDFYITQELFKNVDANYSSTRFYIKNNKIYAGPLWDFDLSCGNVSVNRDYFNYLIYNNYLTYGNGSGKSYEGLWALKSGYYQNYYDSFIGILMRCNEFRNALCNRYEALQDRIVNLYKDNELGVNQMDLLQKQYSASFQRNNDKWPVDLYRDSPLYRDNETTYTDSVSFLRSWLMCRNEWLLKELKSGQDE